jgi:lipoprotein-anchoring transpeptidase ErfK/SrfK
MRRVLSLLAGLACAAAAFTTPAAAAYQFDPFTREPIVPQGSFVPQASAIPREEVDYDGRYRAGTIVISTSERRLYYVLGNGRAIRYGIGVGRPGFTWAGTKQVSMKREWPDWRPPAEMLRRRPDLPRHMKGGLDNPLGARAMYLGSTLYRIHGSNEPESIGQAVSSGCFRMVNDDVVDLYERVRVGSRVVVLR